ncbi:MAG: hypothetical protein J6Z18_04365, partial [Prevotella sp.]|nr:hypothetical protein [Prevotella sp.]
QILQRARRHVALGVSEEVGGIQTIGDRLCDVPVPADEVKGELKGSYRTCELGTGTTAGNNLLIPVIHESQLSGSCHHLQQSSEALPIMRSLNHDFAHAKLSIINFQFVAQQHR